MICFNEQEIMSTWQFDSIEPLVTVVCTTYNHEKYVEDALDSFLSQKTNFPFEIVVHDDASTDQTALIIKKYEKKYSQIIKPIYETENQYSKHDGTIYKIITQKVCGKYIAFCEGDDYWIDENKLQLQYDGIEENEKCVCSINKVQKVTNEGIATDKYMPQTNFGTQYFKGDTFVELCLYPGYYSTLSFQLSGFMVNTDLYIQYLNNPPPYRKLFDVGDLPMFLYTGSLGEIYYIEKVMSCYRSGVAGSATSKFRSNQDKLFNHFEIEKKAIKAFDQYTAYQYHEKVDLAIKNREFYMFFHTNNYPKLRMRRYSNLYNVLPKKKKIRAFIAYYFPGLFKIYTLLRQRKR